MHFKKGKKSMYFLFLKLDFNKILFSLTLIFKINHKFLSILTADIGKGTPDQGIIATVTYRLGESFPRW